MTGLVFMIAVFAGLACFMFGYDQAKRAGLIAGGEDTNSAVHGGKPMNRPPLLSVSIGRQQECPNCTRFCNVDDVGIQEQAGDTKGMVLVFCESCNRGFEVMFVWTGRWWQRDIQLNYSPDNPAEFAKFQARLADLVSVAA